MSKTYYKPYNGPHIISGIRLQDHDVACTINTKNIKKQRNIVQYIVNK